MKPREIKKILKAHGWHEEHDGRHDKMVSPDGKTRVPITRNQTQDIPIGTLRRIEKMTGIPLREL
jgi:predicted RNA binding protein YcfA (HicA-like mRNA interferase family)